MLKGLNRIVWLALMAGGGVLWAQPAGTAAADGVQVAIPAGWHWNQGIAQAGGPLSLTSFEHWESGGIPPAGGAEIDITRVPAPRNLQEYIQREMAGSQAEAPVESAVQKNPAVEVTFTDSYGDLKLSTRALYVLHGSRLYKLYLTFRTGDAHAADYAALFHGLAQQAKFE
ncbi:MAG TPA: hypothetical protein VME43_13475 [Bryobacteraceae bacterium]|nr:hypothetical protein [Bryobacteraceae bacterium]